MKLYYHKTDGGAEYLMDKQTISDSRYIVRIDGDITKDAELIDRDNSNT